MDFGEWILKINGGNYILQVNGESSPRQCEHQRTDSIENKLTFRAASSNVVSEKNITTQKYGRERERENLNIRHESVCAWVCLRTTIGFRTHRAIWSISCMKVPISGRLILADLFLSLVRIVQFLDF